VGARFSAPVQTGPGAHPASYTKGTGSSPAVKRPGRGFDHPPPSSAEVKERVELNLYSPSGSSWPFIGWSLSFTVTSVALAIQNAMDIPHSVLPCLSGLALPYFSKLSHKMHDFLEILLKTKCVFWLSVQLLFETFLILRRTERDIISYYQLYVIRDLHVKYASLFQIWIKTWISRLISEKIINVKLGLGWRSG
jgi:hypothetical protein